MERKKSSVFINDMIVCISDMKISMRNFYTFRKVARLKLNKTKSVDLPYLKGKWPKKEINEITPFIISSNNISWITLIKQVK